MAVPVVNKVEMYFLSLCSTLVSLMSMHNALTHLITLLFIIWSPMYVLHGLAVRAIQCKVLFSSWFAKEPNVATNND